MKFLQDIVYVLKPLMYAKKFKKFENNELSYEKRLEIVFYKNNGISYREISSIIGCSKSAAFAVCKKSRQEL